VPSNLLLNARLRKDVPTQVGVVRCWIVVPAVAGVRLVGCNRRRAGFSPRGWGWRAQTGSQKGQAVSPRRRGGGALHCESKFPHKRGGGAAIVGPVREQLTTFSPQARGWFGWVVAFWQTKLSCPHGRGGVALIGAGRLPGCHFSASAEVVRKIYSRSFSLASVVPTCVGVEHMIIT
jgi:hypothetical protein